MDMNNFAVRHQKTADRVPTLLDFVWKDFFKPTGITLQIDLRDGDFAEILAYYSRHIAHKNSSHNGLEHKLFRATMFKGYNHRYSSFADLQTTIKERSEARYGKDYSKVSYLHHLPPLIMVFSAVALDKLAWTNNSTRLKPTYEQLYKTILNQVESFVCVGEHRYSFILEIGHSGLGLGYDRETGGQRIH
ncbi:hypothetical protein IG631_15693 [Alternaria alternata]|nr:hypothetical protein IG631_15693 [Alternaria alternata]